MHRAMGWDSLNSMVYIAKAGKNVSKSGSSSTSKKSESNSTLIVRKDGK